MEDGRMDGWKNGRDVRSKQLYSFAFPLSEGGDAKC